MIDMLHRATARTAITFVIAMASVSCGGSTPPPKDPDLVADPVLGDDSGIENGTAQTDYQRALAFIEKEHWAEAKVLLTRVLQVSPDNAEAHGYMGLALEKLGDLPGAETSYIAALDRNPKLAPAAQNLAALYLSTNPPQVDKAIAYLEKTIAVVPDHVGVLQNLGYARALKGNVAGAAKAYQAAIAQGDSVELRLAIANVYFDAKQYEQAVPHAKKIVALTKDNANVLATAGLMLAYGKTYDACVKAYDQAIKLKGDEPEWLVRRGTCKHELGNENDALEDYQASIRVKTDFAVGWYYMGLSQLILQKPQSAEFSIQKAVEHGKDTPIGKKAKQKLREIQHGNRP